MECARHQLKKKVGPSRPRSSHWTPRKKHHTTHPCSHHHNPIMATEDPKEDAAPVDSPDAEVLEEEPRNLLLALVSQIRPGMDLSKITLPTFILEPRSMLEKLTDFMTHGELLTMYIYWSLAFISNYWFSVPKIQDPVERMVGIVKWYLSGFYIKPQVCFDVSLRMARVGCGKSMGPAYTAPWYTLFLLLFYSSFSFLLFILSYSFIGSEKTIQPHPWRVFQNQMEPRGRNHHTLRCRTNFPPPSNFKLVHFQQKGWICDKWIHFPSFQVLPFLCGIFLGWNSRPHTAWYWRGLHNHIPNCLRAWYVNHTLIIKFTHLLFLLLLRSSLHLTHFNLIASSLLIHSNSQSHDYAGIIVGTLLMELCGNVVIHCHQTHCKAEIEFKEKVWLVRWLEC